MKYENFQSKYFRVGIEEVIKAFLKQKSLRSRLKHNNKN